MPTPPAVSPSPTMPGHRSTTAGPNPSPLGRHHRRPSAPTATPTADGWTHAGSTSPHPRNTTPTSGPPTPAIPPTSPTGSMRSVEHGSTTDPTSTDPDETIAGKAVTLDQ